MRHPCSLSASGWALLALAGAAGCCEGSIECPDNEVAVLVTARADTIEEVQVQGASARWACEPLEDGAICRPARIPDGDYELIVTAPGHLPRTVGIEVRTFPVPPYSCDCEIPRGQAEVELAAPFAPDAGAAPDAEAASDAARPSGGG